MLGKRSHSDGAEISDSMALSKGPIVTLDINPGTWAQNEGVKMLGSAQRKSLIHPGCLIVLQMTYFQVCGIQMLTFKEQEGKQCYLTEGMYLTRISWAPTRTLF